MSDNKKQPRGRRDTFAVPGDENIVSNKGFLISVPKMKKGPSNPLLESEKNKEKAREAREAAQKKENQPQSTEKNQGGKGRYGHKKHHHGPRPTGAPKPQAPEAQRPERPERPTEERQPQKNQENRPDRGRHGNKKHRFDDRRKGQRPIPQEQKKETTPAPEERRAKESFQDKKRPHKKHKKEKFVPMAPENASEGELLQPIVDRAEILSTGSMSSKPLSFVGSSFSKSSSKEDKIARDENGNEIRFIDKSIPLAQQIAQAEKRSAPAHDVEGGVEVIGVRFREAGKIYYFAPGENKVKAGQAVIVETARGVEYGFCAIGNRFVGEDKIVPPLKPIIRIATDADTERYNGNKLLEESAAKLFKEKVKKLGLEMSLVYVEYTFDNGKVLFYFTADGRVDFRELIKELAAAFKTRIELRQIGVRDEAKIVGGLGICGRPVCCKSFLGEFSQVSIKMAKDQNLFINSSKISGTCGRFMCCIRYEDETYQKEYEKTPKVDAIVETPEGKGLVVESNALAGSVKVLLDERPDGAPVPFKCSEVKILGYQKRDNEKEIEIDQSLLGD